MEPTAPTTAVSNRGQHGQGNDTPKELSQTATILNSQSQDNLNSNAKEATVKDEDEKSIEKNTNAVTEKNTTESIPLIAPDEFLIPPPLAFTEKKKKHSTASIRSTRKKKDENETYNVSESEEEDDDEEYSASASEDEPYDEEEEFEDDDDEYDLDGRRKKPQGKFSIPSHTANISRMNQGSFRPPQNPMLAYYAQQQQIMMMQRPIQPNQFSALQAQQLAIQQQKIMQERANLLQQSNIFAQANLNPTIIPTDNEPVSVNSNTDIAEIKNEKEVLQTLIDEKPPDADSSSATPDIPKEQQWKPVLFQQPQGALAGTIAQGNLKIHMKPPSPMAPGNGIAPSEQVKSATSTPEQNQQQNINQLRNLQIMHALRTLQAGQQLTPAQLMLIQPMMQMQMKLQQQQQQQAQMFANNPNLINAMPPSYPSAFNPAQSYRHPMNPQIANWKMTNPYLAKAPQYPMASGKKPNFPPANQSYGGFAPIEMSGTIATRRPKRASAAKKINYAEDLEIPIDEDDDGADMSAEELEADLINEDFDEDSSPAGMDTSEKINYRISQSRPGGQEEEGFDKILSYRENEDQEEFLIKPKGKSYLHLIWKTRDEIESMKTGPQRIKRFLGKPLSLHHFSDSNIINPEWTRVVSILTEWKAPPSAAKNRKLYGNVVVDEVYYLVKWADLGYDECTWESETDLLAHATDAQEKISEYQSIKDYSLRQSTYPFGSRPPRTAWSPLEKSPEYKDGNLLRNYQLEGLNWLMFCWFNRQSCIIADEMGLGKTIQTISFFDQLSKLGVRGPFLVVAPLSTLPHWEREVLSWTNLRPIIYHGSQNARDIIFNYEFFYKGPGGNAVPGVFRFDVLITTYEMAISGQPQLSIIPWRAGVFDEAHRLKNKASKSSEILKTYRIEHKILATGTPIQNSLDELWSLLNFMEPQKFPDRDMFYASFNGLKRSEDVAKLQELLKPLMLRRLKEDVEKSIPVKEETIIEVELTPVQKRYYRAILERNFAFLTKGAKGSNAPNLLNIMMELRKCCIHPFLIKGAEQRIIEEGNARNPEDIHNLMVAASGKLVLLDKLLKKFWDTRKHKILIFSQMTKCLDLLEDFLKWRHYPMERIDGSIRGSTRQAAIDRFCDENSNSFIFLLCTRAGGVGINLTAADTVIIFDSDWNPQNDLQAQARCHRIGQTKAVKIYRLVTRGTYERDMFDRAGMKLGLDRAVLQRMGPSSDAGVEGDVPQLSKKEVELLLKKGAYGLVMDNDDDAVKFCAEDIDQILERRTTVIKHDPTKGSGDELSSNSAIGAGGSSIFSKASFHAGTGGEEVDLDDPNFWEIWAKRAQVESGVVPERMVMDEPRHKRQLKRLRETANILEMSEFVKSDDSSSLSSSNWSDQELLDLSIALSTFGTSALDRTIDSLSTKTKGELIVAARVIIRYCSANSSVDDQKFKEDNEKLLLPHLDEIEEIWRGALKKEGKDADISLDTKKASEAEINTNMSENLKKYFDENGRNVLLSIYLMDVIRRSFMNMDTSSSIDQIKIDEISLPHHVSGEGPSASWNKKHDQLLLLAVYRNGIETNIAKLFDLEEANTLLTQEEIKEIQADSVVDRLKKICMALQKRAMFDAKMLHLSSTVPSKSERRRMAMSDTVEDEYVPAGLKKSGDSEVFDSREKRKELAVNASKFSKKEKSEFIKALSAFGLPAQFPTTSNHQRIPELDWGLFKEIYGFTYKNDEALFDLAYDIVEESNKSIRKKTVKEVDKKGAKPPKEDIITVEIIKNDLDNFPPAEDNENVDEVEEQDEELEENEEEEEEINPDLQNEKAIKLLERVKLMSVLRNSLVVHPNFVELVGELKKNNSFPSWWQYPEHDIALFNGLAYYGFGKLELIISDANLPFHQIYKDAFIERQKKISELSTSKEIDEKDDKEGSSALSDTPSKRGRGRPRSRTSPQSTARKPLKRGRKRKLSGIRPDDDDEEDDNPVSEDALNSDAMEESDEEDSDSVIFNKLDLDLIKFPKETAILRRLEILCECFENSPLQIVQKKYLIHINYNSDADTYSAEVFDAELIPDFDPALLLSTVEMDTSDVTTSSLQDEEDTANHPIIKKRPAPSPNKKKETPKKKSK